MEPLLSVRLLAQASLPYLDGNQLRPAWVDHPSLHPRRNRRRRDHAEWYHRAGEHHDADHHRIYGRHAPNRKRYYGDDRDYRWDGRYPRR
jgi:hypothetical protein